MTPKIHHEVLNFITPRKKPPLFFRKAAETMLFFKL